MSTTLVSTPEQSTVEAPTRPRGRTRNPYIAATGIVVGIGLLVLAAVMAGNADFSEDYVSRQLAEQRISFPAASALSPEEREIDCLVKYAGQPLTTGAQAECYANEFIGRHLKSVAGGKTFSELREVQTSLRAQIAEAEGRQDTAAVADLQRQLGAVNGQRQALFEGQNNRGLLLTSFGFSVLGEKAAQAATVAFAGGGAVVLVSAVFLVRALRRRPAQA